MCEVPCEVTYQEDEVPFSFDVVPPEVHLERAPIVRTLSQVRFSPVPELVDDESERELARLLRDDYPVRGWAEGVSIPIPPAVDKVRAEKFRTFEDTEGLWKITVSPEFLALETQGYGRREDFLKRMRDALSAVSEVRRPPKVTRVGLRYTNRIEDPQGISRLVNPTLLGWLPELEDGATLQHQVSQTMLKHPSDGSRILVQSLLLPPGAVFDPTIKASEKPSWVLDIDAFDERSQSFGTELLGTVERLAIHSYQVFYWSVNEDFRNEYRGQVKE